MPNTGANAYPGRYRWLGLLGSLALAAGGLTSGALPAAATGPALRASGGAGTVLVFAGLTVLTAAWLLLGTTGPRTADRPRPTTRWLAATLAWWAAPLLLLPPLFSRDVYSYLAQGAMQASGFDVYADGPAALGGPVAQQVPPVWQHTPAPYGPAFLLLARAAAPLADHPYAGTLLLRLTSVAAVAALAALLPALARRSGTDPAAALHLGALNPLVLLHLVAGAHNDAVPLALMITGLLAATRRHPLAAAALITLAALVKAPAALALPAAWWIAAHPPPDPVAAAPGRTGELGFGRRRSAVRNPATGVPGPLPGAVTTATGGRRRLGLRADIARKLGVARLGTRWRPLQLAAATVATATDGRPRLGLRPYAARELRATRLGVRWRPPLLAAATAVAAAATTLVVTAVAGTGYGWVAALTTPASASSWSPTSGLGRLLADLADVAPEGPVAVVRLLGLAAAAGAVCLLAARVARGEGEPAAALALALAALVALGPAFRPWYALWCVVPAAFAVRTAAPRRGVELACSALAFTVMPDGFAPDSAESVLAAGGLAAGATAVLLAERHVTFQERQPAC
ncbi:polyprenol phosphomannose-dependent alpha 1,6 mannosyltransferase MptB [Kitasatospora phosalacinea]|uniref:polyprenol phosphomannose-dependent alpha 1,6 mannosyltransferase MptB n=1 Tax=Kitasatospora phosalacinea TaxID=2065 RepID=UPI003646EE38